MLLAAMGVAGAVFFKMFKGKSSYLSELTASADDGVAGDATLMYYLMAEAQEGKTHFLRNSTPRL